MGTPRDDLPRYLILQHEAFLQTLDSHLLTAPITIPIRRVLDIGTGCGIWAADLAAEYPYAEIIGVDVFPQPKITAPPNCHFIHMDAEKEWDLGDEKFDVMHTRIVPFHSEHLPNVLRQCYDHLTPGGYIEMQEMWPPCRTDEPAGAPEHSSKIIEWGKLRLEAALKTGVNQAITGTLPDVLAEAGFEDIHTYDTKMPIGTWMEDEKMKQVGQTYLKLTQLGAVSSSQKGQLSTVGLGDQEVEDLMEQVNNELGVAKVYMPVIIVWARKPRQ